MADRARRNVLHQAPPELSPHLDYPVAPWSFEPSFCSLLMMVSLFLTSREKYLTSHFSITIFYLASIFNINQLESAEDPF